MLKKQAILLVEDNRDDELLTIRILKDINLANNVEVARSGQEALDFLAARDNNNLPILVLLDLQMPKLNGLQVLESIRIDQKTRQLPVIMLTSSRAESDRQESYRLGADNYLVKPLKKKQFSDALRQMGFCFLLIGESCQGG